MSAHHAEERRALMAASDAINAARAPRRAPRNWRTEHAELQATAEARSSFPRKAPTFRQRPTQAPPPTGSREIPAWLLAVLVVLTIAALALFAPGAQAAPINCQGDQEAFWQLSDQGRWQEYRDVCGYVYDMPALSLPLPPVIEPPPIPAVPEPASWALFAAGLAVIGAIAARRRRSGSRNRKGQAA